MKLLNFLKTKSILYAGSYEPLLKLFTNFLNGTRDFLQTISVGIITVMAIYYKIREATASAQEDQMFSQKATKVFVILAFIFIVPTLVSVLQSYFG